MKIYINTGPATQISYVDYTPYVVDQSLSIEDSINVPTVVNFTLVASDSAFAVPKRSSYVRVVSEIYAASGGYLQSGQSPLTAGKVLATGFITNEPERDYLGLDPRIGYSKFQFQQHSYKVSVTSDEWLLNTKIVPFIPAFVNQTQGQILARVADALQPGLFDVTSFVASGDVIPYYQYNPEQTWSDMAKTFADSSRYRYKVVDRVVYFQPFGDKALGIQYDETKGQRSFDPTQLKTVVVTLPPVNDALVVGATEPQDKWDNYFVGDGFTSNFQLRNTMFRGSATQLLSDDWTGNTFSSDWSIQDPFHVFSLAGALNVTQLGQPGTLNQTYIVGKNGVELGGILDLQLGEVQFVDTCDGIIGGVYSSSTLTQPNCVAGFNVSPSGSILVTASGVAGIIIQPMLNGQLIGPQVVSKPNHHYQLEIWVGAQNWSRYESQYKTILGDVTYGGHQLTSTADVTFVIKDIDLTFVIATQYNQFVQTGGIGPPIKNIPQVVTQYTARQVTVPSFGVYAPINSKDLNLVLNYTQLSQPPQGSLEVRSLTGASGGLLPVLPSKLTDYIQYSLGFGLSQATATIAQTGDSSQLSFYDDTIPGVGSRIRFVEWAAGQAISRVQNTVAVAVEAVVSGDSGVRSAIMTNLVPQPRTSAECELAAAAVVTDRAYPEFQGTYNINTIPLYYEDILNPRTSDYPVSGRYLFINSPVRAISGQNFFVNTVRTQVLELRGEVLQIELSYGPDLYLEKLLQNFVLRTDNVLTPKETSQAATIVQLTEAGAFYVPMFASAGVSSVVNSLTGNFITVDLGSPPITAAEVRRVDGGWGQDDANLVGLFTTQVFQLPRSARDQAYFIRPRFGNKTSRFSYVARINQPLIPSSPIEAGVSSGVLTLSLNGDVRDIYGVELRLPATVGSTNVIIPAAPTNSNMPVYNVARFTRVAITTPYGLGSGNGFAQLQTDPTAVPDVQVGDVIALTCPNDSSFAGFKVVDTVLSDTVTVPGSLITSIIWHDYNLPFFKSLGSFGSGRTLSTRVGTLQVFLRGNFATLSSGSVTNGVATVVCTSAVQFHAGDTVVVGAGWVNGSVVPAGQPTADEAFFTNSVQVKNVAGTQFSYNVRSTDPQNVSSTAIGGHVGLLQPGATVSGAIVSTNAAVLAQRPILAPSDLVFDLTDPSVKNLLSVAQALNPSGSFVPLSAYFFNLTWDYSSPLLITDIIVPSITGLAVDPNTRVVSWQVATGNPTGYRVQLQDPTTGQTYAQFTVDNPTNPQAVTQFTLSTTDSVSNRLITVTPYSNIGDGTASQLNYSPSGGIAGNLAPYVVGCTWDGLLDASRVLVRVPFDQTVSFALNYVPSQGVVDVAPLADVVCTITKNGVQVGTMTFPAGKAFGPSAVFSGGPVTYLVGDVLRVIGPAIPDTLAADFGFTLSATRGFLNPGVLPVTGGSPQQINLALSDGLSLSDAFDSFPKVLQLFQSIADSESANWSDSVSKTFTPVQLTETLSDNEGANWSDALSKTLASSVLTETLSDNEGANWADSVQTSAPVVVQKAAGSTSAAFGANVTAGNLIIVSMGNGGSTVSSVTDTQGNTYTQVSGVAGSATGIATDVWFTTAGSTGACTVTVTWGTPSSPSCNAFEVSGLAGTVDVSGRVNNGSGTVTGVSLAGTANFNFYVEECCPSHSVTAVSSPWTLGTVTNGSSAGFLVGSGAQQPTFTVNISGNFAISAVAFK